MEIFPQAPHPLYKPSSDLIPCRDPLCAAVQPEYYRSETPEQCDYEVEYADGGSSLGVLLRDAMHFNLTNGLTQSPRLGIGLVILWFRVPVPPFWVTLRKIVCAVIDELLDANLTFLTEYADVDMIKSPAHLTIPWMEYLVLARGKPALSHNSVIRVWPGMLSATA